MHFYITMETRKKLEELRKENNSILEDIAEKMDDKLQIK